MHLVSYFPTTLFVYFFAHHPYLPLIFLYLFNRVLFSLFLSLSQSDRDRLGECRQFMIGLVGLVQHSSLPHLPLNASEVLLSLHQPNNIELWDPQDHMTAFWDISGQVGHYFIEIISKGMRGCHSDLRFSYVFQFKH